MTETLRSVQIDKQEKKNVLTVQSVRMLTWQGRTTHGRCWLGVVWMSCCMTHGFFVANEMATRGPINGHHVSPGQWFKIYVVGRIRPRDLRVGVKLWEGPPNWRATHMVLNTIPFKNYLNLNSFDMGRSSGRGLALAPGHMYICYRTTDARSSDRYHMV